MMISRSFVLGALAAFSLPISAYAHIPGPIASYLDRSWHCKGTPAAYTRIRRQLACDRLPSDYARLEARYRNDPKALATLRGPWVKVVQRVPARN
jgi:hypothetical protein